MVEKWTDLQLGHKKLQSWGKQQWQTCDQRLVHVGGTPQGRWQGLKANMKNVPDHLKCKLLLPDQGNQQLHFKLRKLQQRNSLFWCSRWKQADRNRRRSRTKQRHWTEHSTRLAKGKRNIIYTTYRKHCRRLCPFRTIFQWQGRESRSKRYQGNGLGSRAMGGLHHMSGTEWHWSLFHELQ